MSRDARPSTRWAGRPVDRSLARSRARCAAAAGGAGLENDTGAVSVFVIGISITLLLMAGLVVDGGNAINARQTIADDVEQAARAGATALDQQALRTGGVPVLDRAAARRRAIAYLVALGYDQQDITFPDTMPQTTRQLSVAARDVVPTQVLSLAGKGSFPVSASSTARAAPGITTEERFP
jgi:hypothetical protein